MLSIVWKPKLISLILVMFSLCMLTAAQRTPTETNMPSAREIEARSQAGIPSLREIEETARQGAVWPGKRYKPIDRAELERIKELRRPDPSDEAQYAQFLSRKGTGLIRIFPFSDCEKPLLIHASGPCKKEYPDGSVLIVWEEIERKKSPEIFKPTTMLGVYDCK